MAILSNVYTTVYTLYTWYGNGGAGIIFSAANTARSTQFLPLGHAAAAAEDRKLS
jgi:hypothetical protein